LPPPPNLSFPLDLANQHFVCQSMKYYNDVRLESPSSIQTNGLEPLSYRYIEEILASIQQTCQIALAMGVAKHVFVLESGPMQATFENAENDVTKNEEFLSEPMISSCVCESK